MKIQKNSKIGIQEPSSFCETKAYPCNLFQQNKNMLWKNAMEFYCFSESMRSFKHNIRQPLTIVGLVADDLQQCFEYNELDAQTLTQSVQTLHNQVKKLDAMLEEICPNPHNDALRLLNVAAVVQQLQSNFDENLCVAIDTEASVWGQEEMVLCLFYAFFEMLQSYQASTQTHSPLSVRIEKSGASFECDFANLKNYASMFQSMLVVCNNALKRQKSGFCFEFLATQTGGLLGFFHQNTLKTCKAH